MKIIVLSDTHMPTASTKLPHRVTQELKNADLCIHAGDFTAKTVLEDLKKYCPVTCVHGNMDDDSIKRECPETTTTIIENVKIGIFHGHGSSDKILDHIKNTFQEKMHIYIYGHTHKALALHRDGSLFFNPGSPTDHIFAEYNSYGILEISNGTISQKIIHIE